MDQHTAYGAHTPAIEQLDLTAHGVLGHFAKSSRNAALVKFLISMDRLDRWAVDFDEDASGQQFEIQLLVQELQAFIEAYAGVLHHVPQRFAELLAQLTSSRCMYLVRYVAQHNDAFTGALTPLLAGDLAQPADFTAFRRRLDAFSKAHLLSEIFCAERLREISQIMESYADV
ncbi:type IV secretion protein IcmW [Pseudomonas juntendi]|uniref:type IVB secretion system protein IcmW n=1 Tax=Pseudomonas TaxID=286 RepID=UPI000D86201E|nr:MULTISPECIES: type IV secretion protein IcmW [Pseudomonas]MBH3383309.1 type IV secretion protein IcmW [Pseudomonas juntendi]PYC07963.1 type IV secretion protein IcmW [Pseudomonas sp. MB-090624]WBM32188.1 type IV secretion protein IcmW [Pseudomonas sp. NY11382]